MKPFSAPKEPLSPKGPASRDTPSNLPYSKLSNTPSSARVKRQPSGGEQPSTFFDDLPEFKRLKSSQQQNCTSTKFNEFATPGYKSGDLFQQDSGAVANSKDKSNVSRKDTMFSFMSDSVSDSIFLPGIKGEMSADKTKNNLPKPVFSNPASKSSKKDTNIWSFDLDTQDNLTSLLAAPKSDIKPASSSRKKDSTVPDTLNPSRPKRSEYSDKSSGWSIPRQVLQSNKANESLPSFGLLEETRNTFPSDFNFSNVLNSGRPDMQDSSFLASQKVSQEMMDRRFRNSWLMMKETPLVSKPRLSSTKELPKFEPMDESRDLFADTMTGSNLPIPTFSDTEDMVASSIKSHQTKSDLSVVNETLSQSHTFDLEQNICSPYDFHDKEERKTNASSANAAPSRDFSDLPVPNFAQVPAEKLTREKPVVRQTAETACQTEEEEGDFLSGTQKFRSALYTIFDHPYCKLTLHQRVFMSAVRQLKALGIEPDKHEIQTQTMNISTPSSKPREKSDSQHSKSPPSREHQMDEIVHFGESDFSSELEVMDSTPVTSFGNSTGASDNSQPENQDKLKECFGIVTSSTMDSNECDFVSQGAHSSFDEKIDRDNCSNWRSHDEHKGELEISENIADKLQDDNPETPTSNVDQLQNSKSPKTKPRPIIWPDEKMFFVKLPDLSHPSQRKVDDIDDLPLNKHSISGRDEVTNSVKSVPPENMILKITNSKPVKAASPQQKFVPFFTSQAARKPTENGTEDDPINLSPENKPPESSKMKVPKKSPFMIVGKTMKSNKREPTPSVDKDLDKSSIQLDGNSSIVSESSTAAKNELQICETDKKEATSKSVTLSLVLSPVPDSVLLADRDIKSGTISPPSIPSSPISAVPPVLESSDNLNKTLPPQHCIISNDKQLQKSHPTFYSQQLSNQKLLVRSSSQPVSNTSCFFEHSSTNQTAPVLLSEE